MIAAERLMSVSLIKQDRATMNMQRLLTLFAVLILIVGCQDSTDTDAVKNTDQNSAEVDGSPPAEHKHEPGDELVWEWKQQIPNTDVEIWLGHHGSHFHLGDTIEPSVAIMKGDEAFADAKVFTQLVDPDDVTKTITDEVATVYEPQTEQEIAHYAQAKLVIPADGKGCLVRFRIDFPKTESFPQFRQDMKVNVGH